MPSEPSGVEEAPESDAAVAVAAIVGFVLFGLVSLGGWLLLRRWHASAA
jgi:hypothetical protein